MDYIVCGVTKSQTRLNDFPFTLLQCDKIAQLVKNLPAMRETWVRSLGWEGPLKESMATHFNILAWRIPTDRGAWGATGHGVTKSQTRQ